jgi:hypothetical protein
VIPPALDRPALHLVVLDKDALGCIRPTSSGPAQSGIAPVAWGRGTRPGESLISPARGTTPSGPGPSALFLILIGRGYALVGDPVHSLSLK